MVTPRQWDAPASGDFISCCDSSNPNSRCSPKLDTRRNPGDEALSITNSGGTLRFDLTHGGPHEEGPVSDTPIQIAPVDPAAIAARPPVADGCRESRDKYHALVDTATGCTADADCQSLPALTLPGDALTCAVFVNRSVSASALQSVETQLYGMCQTTSGYCAAPRPAVCRAGRCAEQCAGVNLPHCPGPPAAATRLSGRHLRPLRRFVPGQRRVHLHLPEPEVRLRPDAAGRPDLPAGVPAAQSAGDADLRWRRARRVRGGRRWRRRRAGTDGAGATDGGGATDAVGDGGRVSV